MDIDNQDLSLSFYNYLCTIVGSKDVVRTRRKIFNSIDYVTSSEKVTTISSGSKAEGLDLHGSDYDIIRVWNPFPVYENVDELFKYEQNKPLIRLIMDTDDTKPGYTRLKLYDRNQKYLPAIGKFCSDNEHVTYFSSKLFRESKKFDDNVIHGPCTSTQDGSLDQVDSLRSDKSILQAGEWMHRSRLSWPDNRLMETIVQYGVLFVPIGCKNSPREDLEFRISFNVAEKVLVHSFSHVQLLCYALLKIILNNLIKPHFGELICSYFLKTIMFWVSEESLDSKWKPHNLLQCFDLCFKRLVYCVTYSTCLHYFIPELNFFEDRFSKSEQEELASTLQQYYNFGWQCVLQTDLLCSFIQRSPTQTLPSVSALPSIVYTQFCFVDDILRSVHGALNLSGKQMYAIILSQVNQQRAQRIPVNETHCICNKTRYRNYQKCLSQLLFGLHHDSVSGWILLAALFYTRKQYQQSLRVVNYCLHQCTPDKILLEIDIDTKLQQEFNIEMQKHVRNGFLHSCKQRVMNMVRFEIQSRIIPEELSAIVNDNIEFFSPVVFAHFIRCLCLHRLNRNREKMNALCDLEKTAQDGYVLTPHDEDVINASYTCINLAKQLLME